MTSPFIVNSISVQTSAKPICIVQPPVSSRLKIDFQTVVNPITLAGRLVHFLPNWRHITFDPEILNTIRGYKLEFSSPPVQNKIRQPLLFSQTVSNKIDIEIAALRKKGALSVAKPVSDQFVSNLFLVRKRDGSSRPVINLKDLNAFLPYEEGLRLDMSTVQYLLENLGFVINFEKSCLVPTQQLEFLGFVVNTRDMTLLLPGCKVESIKRHCSDVLAHPEISVRELSQLIGKLTASIQAIFPAPLHYRHLQHLKHQALAQQRVTMRL